MRATRRREAKKDLKKRKMSRKIISLVVVRGGIVANLRMRRSELVTGWYDQGMTGTDFQQDPEETELVSSVCQTLRCF